ncbi:MAG: hypothetical protein H6536_07195 [Bacteroidales bacterium]|nr:hypothetical protein [Bacteroidales bacterium]
MENQQETVTTKNSIEIGSEGLEHIAVTRKWTMFLSILGFVFIALMMFGALAVFSTGMGGFGYNAVFFIVMLGFIVVYFFPIYYLFKFSDLSKIALADRDSGQMTEALNYLKKHYRYMGIFTIVFLALYLLFIVFVVVTAGSMF